jgi:hypothetical protein
MSQPEVRIDRRPRRISLPPSMRSREQLQSAVDAMFRMRAVESPPDAAGQRRIWHRGAGAELLTEVDGRWQVLRQELTVFEEETVRWSRERGFASPPADALGALERYAGQDRFLQHLRDQASRELQRSQPGTASGPTRTAGPGSRTWLWPALVGLGTAVATALAWLAERAR